MRKGSGKDGRRIRGRWRIRNREVGRGAEGWKEKKKRGKGREGAGR